MKGQGRRVGDRKAEEEPIVLSMGDDDNAASRPSGGRRSRLDDL